MGQSSQTENGMKVALGLWSSSICFINFSHNLFISLWEVILETLLMAICMGPLGYSWDFDATNIFQLLVCSSTVFSNMDIIRRREDMTSAIQLQR